MDAEITGGCSSFGGCGGAALPAFVIISFLYGTRYPTNGNQTTRSSNIYRRKRLGEALNVPWVGYHDSMDPEGIRIVGDICFYHAPALKIYWRPLITL